MLGKGAGLYISTSETITAANRIADVTNISGIEKSRNMITIEASLDQDADTMVPGKKVVSDITFTINYEATTDISDIEGYLDNGTLIYFAITKPNSTTGKGGPAYISKIGEAEFTREGVYTQTITITPKNAGLLTTVTVSAGE